VLVAPGSLREGILTVGLAPCEIASVATTVMAGGEAAFAAGILIGSTVATVALSGVDPRASATGKMNPHLGTAPPKS
jgi:2,3-bisphosphoglycerate-independent phosphoglycerate mutase